MPPVIVLALGALGVTVVARVLMKEWRRVNEELHPQPVRSDNDAERERLPKLRRDPQTGVYRSE